MSFKVCRWSHNILASQSYMVRIYLEQKVIIKVFFTKTNQRQMAPEEGHVRSANSRGNGSDFCRQNFTLHQTNHSEAGPLLHTCCRAFEALPLHGKPLYIGPYH